MGKLLSKVAEVQSLVSYALQILAKVQSERKKETDAKNLLLQWRNQSWINARRRLGCDHLRKFLKRRINDTFFTWKQRSMYETTVKRIADEYTQVGMRVAISGYVVQMFSSCGRPHDHALFVIAPIMTTSHDVLIMKTHHDD